MTVYCLLQLLDHNTSSKTPKPASTPHGGCSPSYAQDNGHSQAFSVINPAEHVIGEAEATTLPTSASAVSHTPSAVSFPTSPQGTAEDEHAIQHQADSAQQPIQGFSSDPGSRLSSSSSELSSPDSPETEQHSASPVTDASVLTTSPQLTSIKTPSPSASPEEEDLKAADAPHLSNSAAQSVSHAAAGEVTMSQLGSLRSAQLVPVFQDQPASLETLNSSTPATHLSPQLQTQHSSDTDLTNHSQQLVGRSLSECRPRLLSRPADTDLLSELSDPSAGIDSSPHADPPSLPNSLVHQPPILEMRSDTSASSVPVVQHSAALLPADAASSLASSSEQHSSASAETAGGDTSQPEVDPSEPEEDTVQPVLMTDAKTDQSSETSHVGPHTTQGVSGRNDEVAGQDTDSQKSEGVRNLMTRSPDLEDDQVSGVHSPQSAKCHAASDEVPEISTTDDEGVQLERQASNSAAGTSDIDEASCHTHRQPQGHAQTGTALTGIPFQSGDKDVS